MRAFLALAALALVASSLPMATAQPEAEPVPLSLSQTDLFSTAFAACDGEATPFASSDDVLAQENLAPCCACVDASGNLVCKCNFYPCACTPAATGQCRCVCGSYESPALYAVCLLVPDFDACKDHGTGSGSGPGLGGVALTAAPDAA